MDHKIVVCTVASNDFLVYLERLLASAQKHLPNQMFFIVLVNVDEMKVPYLKSLYRNSEVIHDYVKFNSLAEQSGYCTNRRAKLFPLLMDKYNTPIIWVDADSMFVKNAEELITYAGKYDLSVIYRKDHVSFQASLQKLQSLPKGPLGTPFFGVFLNSVIITNNSVSAKELFHDFSKRVEKMPIAWFADQEGLYLSYRKFKDKIVFKPLGRNICSYKMDSASIIWTFKGERKGEYEYFRKGEEYIYTLRKWHMRSLTKSECSSVWERKDVIKEPILKKIYRLLKKNIHQLKK